MSRNPVLDDTLARARYHLNAAYDGLMSAAHEQPGFGEGNEHQPLCIVAAAQVGGALALIKDLG